MQLTHKAHAYPITAPSTATFGDLKVRLGAQHVHATMMEAPVIAGPPCHPGCLRVASAWAQNFAAKEIGIPSQGIQLLFRGRKKNDSDVLSLSGVKNGEPCSAAQMRACYGVMEKDT